MPLPSSSNNDEKPNDWNDGLQPMYGQRLPGQPLTPPRKPLEKAAGSWAAKWMGAPKLKPPQISSYSEDNDDSEHQNEGGTKFLESSSKAGGQPPGINVSQPKGPPGLGVGPYPAAPPGIGAPQQSTSKEELGWARTPEPRRASVPADKDGAPNRAARQLPQPPSKLPKPPSKAMPQMKVPDVRPAKNMGFLFMQAEEEARQAKPASVTPSAAHDEEEWEFLDEEPSTEQLEATTAPTTAAPTTAAPTTEEANTCVERLVMCPLGCGCEGPAGMLELHVAKYCPNRLPEAPKQGSATQSKAAPRPPGPPPFPVKAPPTIESLLPSSPKAPPTIESLLPSPAKAPPTIESLLPSAAKAPPTMTPPTMTPPTMTPPTMTPPTMTPPTMPFPGSSDAVSPEAPAPSPVLSLPPLPVFPGMPALRMPGTSGKAASLAGQNFQQPTPADVTQGKMPSPVAQMPPPMQSQPRPGFQMPGGEVKPPDQFANVSVQQLAKQSQFTGTAPQSQQPGGMIPPTMLPPGIPPALAAMFQSGVNPKAMLPPLPVFPSATVSGSQASQQSTAPPALPPALAAMLPGHSAQADMRPPVVEHPAPVPRAQVAPAPAPVVTPPAQVASTPAPVAPTSGPPTSTQSAAPPSSNPLLTIIRLGIANEDRAGVRAAVDAATKAGVKLEPNIQNMLKQWLGELPLQKQSQSTPEVKTPFEPNLPSTAAEGPLAQQVRDWMQRPRSRSRSRSPDNKPPQSAVPYAAISGTQGKSGNLPPQSMPQEFAGAQAKQSGGLPPQSMPKEFAIPYAAAMQAKQSESLLSQSMPPDFAIQHAALPGVQAKQGGLAPQSMPATNLPAPAFPPMPVFPPMPPAVGLPNAVPSAPMVSPSPVSPIPTQGLSSSPPVSHNEPPLAPSIASSATSAAGEAPSTQANVSLWAASTDGSVEATAPPAPSVAKAPSKVLPPAPPGAGVSIFKKPVLKGKDVDIDKAMDDFFSEIGGDLLGDSEETALAEEKPPEPPPEPQAAQKKKWTCPKCGEVNKASRTKCNNCGHERPEVVETQSAPEVPSTSDPSEKKDEPDVGIVANDGNFMARFLAMQSGTSKEQAPPPETPPESPSGDAPAPPSETGEDSLNKLKRSRAEMVRKIQEERKAARRREASPPPPPREKSPPPPPVAAEPPRPPPEKGFKAWPGQKDEDDKDKYEKKDKQPEAWEYMKKDVWGQGNFFSFDSF